jgi:hypothetical protein
VIIAASSLSIAVAILTPEAVTLARVSRLDMLLLFKGGDFPLTDIDPAL